MRRAARVDANHSEICKAFRALGFAVADTSKMGGGFPDAIISKANKTALTEFKYWKNIPSKRRLNDLQQKFRAAWKGTYLVVESLNDVEYFSREWERI